MGNSHLLMITGLYGQTIVIRTDEDGKTEDRSSRNKSQEKVRSSSFY